MTKNMERPNVAFCLCCPSSPTITATATLAKEEREFRRADLLDQDGERGWPLTCAAGIGPCLWQQVEEDVTQQTSNGEAQEFL